MCCARCHVHYLAGTFGRAFAFSSTLCQRAAETLAWSSSELFTFSCTRDVAPRLLLVSLPHDIPLRPRRALVRHPEPRAWGTHAKQPRAPHRRIFLSPKLVSSPLNPQRTHARTEKRTLNLSQRAPDTPTPSMCNVRAAFPLTDCRRTGATEPERDQAGPFHLGGPQEHSRAPLHRQVGKRPTCYVLELVFFFTCCSALLVASSCAFATEVAHHEITRRPAPRSLKVSAPLRCRGKMCEGGGGLRESDRTMFACAFLLIAPLLHMGLTQNNTHGCGAKTTLKHMTIGGKCFRRVSAEPFEKGIRASWHLPTYPHVEICTFIEIRVVMSRWRQREGACLCFLLVFPVKTSLCPLQVII